VRTHPARESLRNTAVGLLLVLVDGDPTRDINDLRRLSLVIQGHHAYAPAPLHEALGIQPFAPAAAIERAAAP
jgi:hypothetical protein